ncbi:glycerophosphodiester phosphodiesterase family protein [Flavobacteriaceae bacterium]|jgi:glycerophosphoryl diester phosphodiesterase|nr:glycerophosphodiester phosphodiesterase family protein [Flavobacteriaceae bacterium]
MIKHLIFLFTITGTMILSCTPKQNPLVIGHRGARGHLAENTLPSIAKAIELGVDGIEIDIFKCASGELVVFHDQTLEKLTNSKGYIEQLTLDSIRKIDVLNGFTIPTLEEVLDLINGRVFLNIELKGTQTALLTNEIILSYFERKEWDLSKILISSFNWEELEIFYSVNSEVSIAILTEDDPLDAIPIAKQLNAVAINPEYLSLNTGNIDKIKKEGLKIFTWTVNDPQEIKDVITLGVDGIITDFPERVPLK